MRETCFWLSLKNGAANQATTFSMNVFSECHTILGTFVIRMTARIYVLSVLRILSSGATALDEHFFGIFTTRPQLRI